MPWYGEHMYIKVRVQAGAKTEKFESISKDHFKVAVKEPAKQNLANRRVMELVGAHFKIAANQVRLISGHRSPSKIFSIPD